MRTRFGLLLIVGLLLVMPGLLFANGGGDKEADQDKIEISYYWPLYEGVTEEYRLALQTGFNDSQSEIEIEIIPVDWEQQHDKLTTALASGKPPAFATVATRWLLEFVALDAVEPVENYVSSATMNNIADGLKVAVVNGELMGLPVAAGARILAYNADLTTTVPTTFEGLREAATDVVNSSDAYGVILPGKKHAELSDFVYYFYGAGGDFFETKADGSYGKCTVNSPAGVQALSFMVQIAEDKIIQDGFTSMDRKGAQPIFYAGKAGYVMIGAWVESAAADSGEDFNMKYAQIPAFEGHSSAPLVVTDSVAFFSDAGEEQLKAAGKFIDFWYGDDWKPGWDELVGFPPVTVSAAKLPQFQTPLYQALNEAAVNAKGWPLMDGFAEISDLIWDANEKAFLGIMTPQEALDEAADKIDKIRGM
jgi:multiple sugar transport system substrate-binding protein